VESRCAPVAVVLALIPPPEGLPQHAWWYFAIFAGVIVGLMFEPLPGGAIIGDSRNVRRPDRSRNGCRHRAGGRAPANVSVPGGAVESYFGGIPLGRADNAGCSLARSLIIRPDEENT